MNDSLTREIFGNIDTVSKVVFYLCVAASVICCAVGCWRRIRSWQVGARGAVRTNVSTVLRRFVTQVMTLRGMHQTRRSATRAHQLMFYGFVILLIGTVLVAVEHYGAVLLGRPASRPWLHKGLYFAVFELSLDLAGIGFILGCLWFTVRRLRQSSSMDHRASDWIVLAALLMIGVSGYVVEGARIIREQTPHAWLSPVGWTCAGLLRWIGVDAQAADRVHWICWWTHALTALGLIAVVPYCRLFHLVAGSINLAVGQPPLGKLEPVSIQSVEETGKFGVQQVEDFPFHQLLQLDACVACGRCQDVCPAFEAGKPLSPLRVVQDLRQSRDAHPANECPSLHDSTISAETLWSCTTCQACAAVCPLGVQPVTMITDMRRYLVGAAAVRGTTAAALQKTQRSGNPWGMPARDRFRWAEGLQVPTTQSNPEFELLYWVGCAAAYDRRIQKVARAMVQLLQHARVNFAVLGPEERCSGESARRIGEEFVFQELATSNIETLRPHQAKTIVTHCPHCLNSLRQDYPDFGGHYHVIHHTTLLQQLIDAGKLDGRAAKLGGSSTQVTYHDPCYLARVADQTDAPRQLIDYVTSDTQQRIEPQRCGKQTACCGAGGGRMWMDDAPTERIGTDRIDELLSTGADTIAVACPFCLMMVSDGVAGKSPDVQVRDVSELLAEALDVDRAEASSD